MINRVELIGRVGQDPEIKSTANGVKVANLSIATTERYKKGDEWQERTEWHRVVFWDKNAEVIEKYVTKGCLIRVEAKLQTKKWEKDGETKYTLEILGSKFNILSWPKSSQDGATQPEITDEGDDLPF